MTEITIHPASYRDPSGFIFDRNGILYRQVNRSYARQYETLMRSGLYDRLTDEALLIPHTEIPDNFIKSPDHHLTLLPRQLSRLSYASEWCPEQLRDAALLTLRIQQLAMEHGMSLKDATPFNIQFDNGKAIFIDTLSFDTYDPSKPWIAYRQFCECFLFPLYIHRYALTGTHKISSAWPDGIPVSLTARLLPLRSRLNAGAWLHVFLQNRVTSLKRATPESKLQFSKTKLTQLIGHLHVLVSRMVNPIVPPSAWSDYYSETILGKTYLEAKERLFRGYLHSIEFADALDLGCNDGRFSKILAQTGVPVIAADFDWPCISKLYREKVPDIQALIVDLANPTPAAGFRNAERACFTDRAASDLVIALALIHHLALRNNVPLPLIAGYLGRLTNKYLIIEFIPLSDEKAKELTARKQTLPAGYNLENFESAFSREFRIERKDPIPGTDRFLYLLKKT
jgi:SAM-dependent methyltransferase